MNQPTHAAPIVDDGDEIDLRQLFGILLDNKWLIGAVTGAFLLLSLGYALLAAPVYQANAMVQVEQKMPTLPGLSDLSDLAGDSAPEAVTEIALMTSRMVVGKVVDDLHMAVTAEPARLPLFGGFIARHYSPDKAGDVAGAWPGLSSYDFGGASLDIQHIDLPTSLVGTELTLVAADEAGQFRLYDEDDNLLLQGTVGAPAQDHGVTLLVKALAAHPGQRFALTEAPRLRTIGDVQQTVAASEQGKDSGIIAISYQDTDPARATAVLNAVVNQYVHQNVARASAEAANSLEFVKEQLPQIHQHLKEAEDALAAYQTKVSTADISLQTKGLLDQVVVVDTNLSQLKLQQAEVEGKFTAKHPAYHALMVQIGDLSAKKDKLEGEINKLPDTQQGLLRLMRDVQVTTQTYTEMMGQGQQLSIAQAGTVGNARVIDHAQVDTSQPVKPKKAVVVLGGTMLGGFLAVAFVFIRHMLNPAMEDPAEIEQLGLAVFASVPHSPQQDQVLQLPERRRRLLPFSPERRLYKGPKRVRLLAMQDPADLAIEAMRSLRTALHFATLEAKNNVLMIAGASPGAGKTFVSSNLAAVIAQAGQRVLLVDADMRRGMLHHVMGRSSGPGLSELLAGRAELAQAVHDTPIEGLHFIGRGHAPPNPSELLMRPSFGALVKQLSTQYDLVIIDTPPVLAVTDAVIVGSHAATSLLVVRFGHNQAREVTLAHQRFEQNRVRLHGAIFNAVQRRATGYYAYGYYKYDHQVETEPA
ncbi:polysaccharide biosynthesis tyrosine autokinase [Frateuria hangzhouensis]|uniref:polysaccharide biosynthesis tyrosine autokinase n=1 Tax=Frateuria hangzhouensis TaxID=2995589 RepID=UPI002260F22D|nr:polysaccharide biosynthesis tyrosine autokinase [Frateuria sp. STR12]MCX7515282.1 polysaccharide biosynthesis tyrosine autokinase [Frateuria sp. STR12]